MEPIALSQGFSDPLRLGLGPAVCLNVNSPDVDGCWPYSSGTVWVFRVFGARSSNPAFVLKESRDLGYKSYQFQWFCHNPLRKTSSRKGSGESHEVKSNTLIQEPRKSHSCHLQQSIYVSKYIHASKFRVKYKSTYK